MLLIHGAFGIGGLIGPIVVYFFEEYAYYALGVLMVLVIPVYMALKTP